MLDPEVVKALELVEEHNRNRLAVVKEQRLYYNSDGSIIGLWETDHPAGEYIVLADTDLFYSKNSQQLRVVNGQLKYIDPALPPSVRIKKGLTGQAVVKGHAALALMPDEQYTEIEYYDRNS